MMLGARACTVARPSAIPSAPQHARKLTCAPSTHEWYRLVALSVKFAVMAEKEPLNRPSTERNDGGSAALLRLAPQHTTPTLTSRAQEWYLVDRRRFRARKRAAVLRCYMGCRGGCVQHAPRRRQCSCSEICGHVSLAQVVPAPAHDGLVLACDAAHVSAAHADVGQGQGRGRGYAEQVAASQCKVFAVVKVGVCACLPQHRTLSSLSMAQVE